MFERFYFYRGFEIGIQPKFVTEPTSYASPPHRPRYCCTVQIRKMDSDLRLDTFSLEGGADARFESEFEAVLAGCIAAERCINVYRAEQAEKVHLLELAA